MKKRRPLMRTLAYFLALLLLLPQLAAAQGADGSKSFKPEELDQLVAPIALYPDSLVTQVLMASTYPLEIVQAARWAKQNKDLKGDALGKALEKQSWDPSVKSLVNFPQVLDMMNEKVDWCQMLGDAFLGQEKDVLASIQRLRAKAQAAGNLKTTTEQVVKVEKEVIIIEPANPQVVYVPTYNPTVVYGAWPYPAYPPYSYYPPGWVPGAGLFAFGAGVAVGAAWGHAWGHCDWNGGSVNVNVNQNANLNQNIDRSKYQNKVTSGAGGQGKWQHNPESRKGVSYRDQSTAQKFGKDGPRDGQARNDYRGRGDSGRQDAGRGDAGRGDAGRGDAGRGDAGRGDAGRGDAGRQDQARGDSGRQGGSDKGAFSSQERGSQTREASNRGNESMSSSRGSGGGSSSMSRGSGGGGGASSTSRSSGGGGGSRSSGGGGGGSRGGGGRR